MNSTFERSPQLEGFDNESVIGPSRGYQGVLLISEGDETFTRVANNGALNIRLNVEPDTRFAIASLTKQFIGVALYRLSSQGKVNLHSALSRYFPNLSGEWGHVTPWRLLNHTARVNDHGYSLIKASTPWSNCRSSRSFEYSFENLLSKAFENPVNAFSVGESTLYSNAAYTVLAALIKRVSKVDYREFIRREFIIPLKMENTGFIESEFSRVQIARGYGFVGENEDSIDPPIDFSVFQGSADMYSNADDMNKWASAIREGSLIPAREFLELVIVTDMAFELMRTKGELGFTIRDICQVTRVRFRLISKTNRTIVILSNDSRQPTEEFMIELFSSLEDLDNGASWLAQAH